MWPFAERKPLEEAELERRLLLLKAQVEAKLQRLEARLLPRRQALEKGLEEFRKTLAHLEALAQEGRYPPPVLAPALERERLRIAQVEAELKAISEKLSERRTRLYLEARGRGARLGAREARLKELWPLEVDGEPVANL
ncbi:hypothetical protein [Thermus sp.]|uniref:hypothetical protein n=1 Tax=Thermus sp. TaxID=275 RepID=UPI00307DB8D3